MGDKVIDCFVKLRDFIFSREVGIELVKVAFTALIGFVTFKIYQMYRNKKDNSKLYIQMIKLEREIAKNLQLIEAIIDDHSRYQLLNSIFRGDKSEGLYDLFELVDSLNLYVYQNIIYEYGEPVDAEYVYAEYPYEIIQQLNFERSQVEAEGENYPGHLDDIDAAIEKHEEKSIFTLLVEIEKAIECINIDNHEMRSSIEYLREKLNKYNSNDSVYKNKTLDKFCSQLINRNNIFSESLNLFKDYENLSRKIHKEKFYKDVPSKIEFKVWQNQDMDLLGIYSSEDYLILEEFYHKNNIIEIGNWELERAEELSKEMQTLYEERILRIRDMLKKTLNKTNWIFGKI